MRVRVRARVRARARARVRARVGVGVRGDTVSSIPRYAAKPIEETSA